MNLVELLVVVTSFDCYKCDLADIVANVNIACAVLFLHEILFYLIAIRAKYAFLLKLGRQYGYFTLIIAIKYLQHLTLSPAAKGCYQTCFILIRSIILFFEKEKACRATKHCIGSDISIKSLKRKTQHQRRLQFNQRVKRAF